MVLWRVDDSLFFYSLSLFCILSIEFHCSFFISCKIIPLCLLILYFDKEVICRRDFLSFPLCFFPYLCLSSCLPRLSVLFQSCCSHVRVFGKSLLRAFPISYSHAAWQFRFSLVGARETKHAQRTLLQALFMKWPFKSFN